MEVFIYFLAALACMFILVNLTSFIIILLHEFSHAIPALIFTKGNVTVFIGSYGDQEGLSLKISRLQIFIKPKWFYFTSGGMCRFQSECSNWADLIIVLAGPVVTAIIASTSFIFIFHDGVHAAIRLLFLSIFVHAIWSMISNLDPRKIFTTEDGKTHLSDGYQIKLLFSQGTDPRNFQLACKYYLNDDVQKAIEYIEMVSTDYIDTERFRLATYWYQESKNYEGGHLFICKYLTDNIRESLTGEDYTTISFIEMSSGHHTTAIVFQSLAIAAGIFLRPNYNNRGLSYMIIGEYESAMEDLDNAIEHDPDFAYPFINRAFVKIKQGQPEEALIDIQISEKLDPTNVYLYLTKGMYLLEKGQYAEALASFETGKAIDPTIIFIDDYITEAREKTTHIDPLNLTTGL